MTSTITISRSVKTAVQPTQRVLQVASMFGLGVDQSHEIAVVPRCEIPLPHLAGRSGIVFVTGPSGSGKSTIVRLIGEEIDRSAKTCRPIACRQEPGDNPALRDRVDSRAPSHSRCLLLRFDALPPLDDVALVDALVDALAGGRLALDRTLMLLSVAGLNEAFVMLRRPSELSDGQRYRLRLAQVMAMLIASRDASGAADLRHNPTQDSDVVSDADQVAAAVDKGVPVENAVVLADEFGATLDRITAKTMARNLRRWLSKHAPLPVSFICATTHDDLLEALEPDVLVWKDLGENVEVVTR
jgi:ABC-type ATPase with predicted acetyltransferase domain